MISPDLLDIVAALVIAIILHELAHGLVARLLGDHTAQLAGRLTLNPVNHIDRMGSIAVPLILALGQFVTLGRVAFLYGWARPVPVDPQALRLNGRAHPRQLMAVVAAAGPVMNFLLAIAGGFMLRLGVSPVFCVDFIMVNLTLGLFNLLPVPPMDGGRIAVGFLPLGLARIWARAEKYGIFAVLLVLFILPAVLAQQGVRFNPLNAAMAQVLPWAEGAVLRLSGN